MSENPLYCVNHPNVETILRCSRCERPICVRCAVSTPTGYRCRDCVRGQQKVFSTAQWYDYLLASCTAAFASFIASLLVFFISGFFYGLFVLMVAPSAGVGVAEVVRFATRRRRSPLLFKTALVGMIVGGLPMLLYVAVPTLRMLLAGGLPNIFALLPLIWQIVYLFVACPAMYYRLSGIRMK